MARLPTTPFREPLRQGLWSLETPGPQGLPRPQPVHTLHPPGLGSSAGASSPGPLAWAIHLRPVTPIVYREGSGWAWAGAGGGPSWGERSRVPSEALGVP